MAWLGFRACRTSVCVSVPRKFGPFAGLVPDFTILYYLIYHIHVYLWSFWGPLQPPGGFLGGFGARLVIFGHVFLAYYFFALNLTRGFSDCVRVFDIGYRSLIVTGTLSLGFVGLLDICTIFEGCI